MKHKKILVISAMKEEMAPFVSYLPPESPAIERGKIMGCAIEGSPSVYYLVTGVGSKNVEKRLRKQRLFIETCDYVIVVGICGASDPVLRIGDMCVPARVWNEQSAVCVLSADLRRCMLDCCQPMVTCSEGDMYMSTRLVTARQKKELRVTLPSVTSVDMESYAMVSLCAEYGVPVVVVKAVSDRVHSALPKERFLRQGLGFAPRHIVWKKMWLSPVQMMKLFFLRKHMRKAIEMNVACVKKCIEVLMCSAR